MVCAVCLSIFLWIRDMARLLCGTFVYWWYVARIWPSVTDMQHYYACMFSLMFSSKCAWYACFHILLAQDEIPESGSVHPSRWLPLHEKIKSNREWRLSTLAKWGGIWTDAWICLQYWVVIWVAGYFNSPLYCTVYGVCHRQDTLWP